MKKLFLGFGVFLPFIAFAAVFPGSGIDFDNSTIRIHGPSGSTCLGESITSPHSFTFTEMGFDNFTHSISNFGNWSGGTTTRCFQTAGPYNITMRIVDNAGNETSLSDSIVIAPDTPDETSSTLNVVCNNTVANNTDTCDLTLSLRDRFANVVTQNIPGLSFSAATQSFSDDANLGTEFHAGLRLAGNNLTTPYSFDWDSSIPPSFGISAVAPSIQTVPITEEGIPAGTNLSTVVTRPITFSINNLKEIQTNGLVSGTPISSFEVPSALRFDAPVAIMPGFNQAAISFAEDIEVTATYNVPDPLTHNVNCSIESSSEHLFVDAQEQHDYEAEMDAYEIAQDNWDGVSPEPIHPTPPVRAELSLTTDFPLGTPDDTLFVDVPKMVYAITQHDNPADVSLTTTASYMLDSVPVSYVAGAMGQLLADGTTIPINQIVGFNPSSVDFRNIGISIEGFVVGDQDQMLLVGGNEESMTSIANNLSTTVRDKIVENAYQFIRNASNIITDPATITSWDAFNAQNIVVVDLTDRDLAEATLTLPSGTLPSGSKTLIVLNGNVQIAGDITYGNIVDDSFGIILLRDKAGPYPERGNIFVHEDVQKISGTIFADGGFFNGTSLSTANTGPRNKQLRLVGSLFSRNTIGGSRRTNTTGEFFTPWGTTPYRDTAKLYDLHEIRQYDYSSGTTYCVLDAATCDPNNAAFILRQDQKINLLPPPVFLTD